MNKSLVLGIATLLIWTAPFTASQAQDKKPEEKTITDRTLPNVTLTDMNGKQVNVSELGKNGKLTVLDFWATWCVPCKKELNNISEIYDDWQKKYNVTVVAVSIDDSRSSTKVKPYAEGQRWTYQQLLDVNQDLKRALNIQSVPFTLLIDKTGKIVFSHSGYTEGDENTLEEAIQAASKK